MKNLENKGFLPIPDSMGWNVVVESPFDFKNTNKINGFMHISYGMTLISDFGFRILLVPNDDVPCHDCIPHLVWIPSA